MVNTPENGVSEQPIPKRSRHDELVLEPPVHPCGDVMRVPFVQMPLVHPHPAALVHPSAVVVAEASCQTDEENVEKDSIPRQTLLLTAVSDELGVALQAAERLQCQMDTDRTLLLQSKDTFKRQLSVILAAVGEAIDVVGMALHK